MFYIVWNKEGRGYDALEEEIWFDIARKQMEKATQSIPVDFFVVCTCEDEHRAVCMVNALNLAGM